MLMLIKLKSWDAEQVWTHYIIDIILLLWPFRAGCHSL